MIRLQRWRDFQHYKHKAVPWVKLYAALLDDHDYRALPLEARAVLMDLWMLGSRTLDGVLTVSRQSLGWRLRIDDATLVRCLQSIAAQQDTEGNPQWITVDSSVSLDTVYSESITEKSRVEKRESRETTVPAQRSRKESDPAPWVAEAHALYSTHIGLLPFGRLGKALKPVVDRHGWGGPKDNQAHEWFAIYCRHRPYLRANGTMPDVLNGDTAVKNTLFCSPEDFVKNLAHWRDQTSPATV